MLRYCSLFSGSNGNATYIGTASGGILVDAGVSARRLETALKTREIDPSTVRALLLTHEHIDHVSGVTVLCKRYDWPVLAAEETLEALIESGKLSPEQRLYVARDGVGQTVGDLEMMPFSLPHDSRHCLGYRLTAEDGRSVAIATDMGYIP